MRTDIPAFYSSWLFRRLQEGYVMVRNPYNDHAITRYRLSPEVVDGLAFCTKNPIPMLDRLSLLDAYKQYWFVTITPYGKDIEPHVPDKREILRSFRELSRHIGIDSIGWRYDPILLTEDYSLDYHLEVFSEMASYLKGYTESVVISFIDLYSKVRTNFPEAREVAMDDRLRLSRELSRIARENGMVAKACSEAGLEGTGVSTEGCLTKETFEKAFSSHLVIPARKSLRQLCHCVLGADIGAYNSCGHLCRYCYANYDAESVRKNMARHEDSSPILIGNIEKGDVIHQASQLSWIDRQGRLFE